MTRSEYLDLARLNEISSEISECHRRLIMAYDDVKKRESSRLKKLIIELSDLTSKLDNQE